MKRILKYLVVCVLLVAGSWMGVGIYKRYQAKKESEQRIQTLQHVGFESLAGGQVYIDEFDQQKPTVVIYFSPACEHCQYEATEISRHADRFERANTLLITPESSVDKVEAFALTYHLNEVDNLSILLDKDKQFIRHFGTAVFPAVFIYGPDRKLVKYYKGEIKIEAILDNL